MKCNGEEVDSIHYLSTYTILSHVLPELNLKTEEIVELVPVNKSQHQPQLGAVVVLLLQFCLNTLHLIIQQ